MTSSERRELATRRRLRDDLPFFCAQVLRIRPKESVGDLSAGETAGAVPLVLNRAQRHIHACLEEQRARLGMVRAIIVKGRQQGASTYIGARFYHRVIHNFGLRAFILSHEEDSTQNLFDMVKRYHAHNLEELRPTTGRSNFKELVFPVLDSGYRVATAGSKEPGRSQTVQLLHGSEVAFWPNARRHLAGLLQGVPALGSEVILESTGNGMGNVFHAMAANAIAGRGIYQLIFVPWFWQDEYRAPVPEGFALTPEDREYQKLHGLDLEQMAWRALKIHELGDDEDLFRQEYPATVDEAFQFSGVESLIKARHVMRARRHTAVEPSGPLVVGVDPARFGDDATAVIARRGRKAFGLQTFKGRDTMEVAGICKRILDGGVGFTGMRVERMFVDVGGLGAGVVDRLREMGFSKRVRAVNFGGKPLDAERYSNKRSEMWGEMRDWLADEDMQADLPDSDALQADLTAPGYSWDSSGRLVLETKESMRKRGIHSPDAADALALTFAAPVRMSPGGRQQQVERGDVFEHSAAGGARRARQRVAERGTGIGRR